jgi:hypothetical protein
MWLWFKSKRTRNAEKVMALVANAVRQVHPGRFVDPSDAALVCQPELAALNTLLGRGDSSRFDPVTFEEIVSRVRFYEERGLLNKLETISSVDEIVSGVIMAAVHEIELSRKQQKYSSSNKGAEIREGAEFIFRCLNRHAEKTR